jgi:rhodanese-related sulfurtransferase
MSYFVRDEFEFDKMFGHVGGLIVDVRNDDDWQAEFTSNSLHIDLFKDNFSEFLTRFDRAAPILILCNERSKSKGALRMLEEMGFKDLYQLRRNM